MDDCDKIRALGLGNVSYMSVFHDCDETVIYGKDIVEVDFLWNRTVESLKTSFHPLLWSSSGLRDS